MDSNRSEPREPRPTPEPESVSPHERRRHNRVSALLGALLEKAQFDLDAMGTVWSGSSWDPTLYLVPDGKAYDITVTEISAGGLKAFTSVAIPYVGQRLTISLLSGLFTEPVSILSEVAWKKEEEGYTSFGVSFLELSPGDEERLKQALVHTQLPPQLR